MSKEEMTPPQVNKGEGMNEIARNILDICHLSYLRVPEIEAVLFKVAAEARYEAIGECANVVEVNSKAIALRVRALAKLESK